CRDMFRLTAAAMNVLVNRHEPLWTPGDCSVVEVVSPEALEEKVVYCLLNPMAAEGIDHPSEWPGFVSLPHMMGGARLRPRKPNVYFRRRVDVPHDERVLPERPTLRFAVPSGYTADTWRAAIEGRLEAALPQARRQPRTPDRPRG